MKIFDKVKIKNSNVSGIIVDIFSINDKDIYVIQDNKKYCSGEGQNVEYPIYECILDELELQDFTRKVKNEYAEF